MTILFVLIAIAVIAGLLGRHHTNSAQKGISGFVKNTQLLPHALSMFILVAHAGELLKSIEHTSPVHIVAALLLLAIWVAAKSGAEGELS
jgi:nitrate reductase gamma subunit